MSLEHAPGRRDNGAAGHHRDQVFLNQHATAALLGGLSVRTLERWRLEGVGPVHYRFGRRVMYARTDVLEWASAQRRTSTSDPGREAA